MSEGGEGAHEVGCDGTALRQDVEERLLLPQRRNVSGWSVSHATKQIVQWVSECVTDNPSHLEKTSQMLRKKGVDGTRLLQMADPAEVTATLGFN